ncbi:MAG: DUF1971 domain-containing protein [Calditrichia bacterium]
MKTLPDSVSCYNTTAVFTEDTMPEGIKKDHFTKRGTWGIIRVHEGELEYVTGNGKTHILNSEKPGLIEPEVKHFVKPRGAVVFHLEFYK